MSPRTREMVARLARVWRQLEPGGLQDASACPIRVARRGVAGGRGNLGIGRVPYFYRWIFFPHAAVLDVECAEPRSREINLHQAAISGRRSQADDVREPRQH